VEERDVYDESDLIVNARQYARHKVDFIANRSIVILDNRVSLDDDERTTTIAEIKTKLISLL
jgi:hypothetical protein